MSKTSLSDRNDLSTEVRLTFAWKWVIHWGRQTLNANLSSRAKTKRKVQDWRGHAPWRSQWFLSFGPSARFRTVTTVSFFASASYWTLPASNQSMIWEPNLRRIVNRLLLLWYYLAFRVVILHDRHLPSIAAHNNSHRGCRPRQPRETQHCTLCTELAFSFEQIINHFPDPGHNPWLQLAFPLKFLLIHRRVPAAWQQKRWHSCGLCLLTESNYSDCISTDYLQPLICRHMHWPHLESEFDDNDKGEKSSRDKT